MEQKETNIKITIAGDSEYEITLTAEEKEDLTQNFQRSEGVIVDVLEEKIANEIVRRLKEQVHSNRRIVIRERITDELVESDMEARRVS